MRLRSPGDAETLTRGIIDRLHQRNLFGWLVVSVALVGDTKRTERFALRIGDPFVRAEALAQLARHLIEAGASARAQTLMLESEKSFLSVSSRGGRDDGFAYLAELEAMLGYYPRSDALIARIGSPLDPSSSDLKRYRYGYDSRSDDERMASAYLRVGRTAKSRRDIKVARTYADRALQAANRINYYSDDVREIRERVVQLKRACLDFKNEVVGPIAPAARSLKRDAGKNATRQIRSVLDKPIVIHISNVEDGARTSTPDPSLQADLSSGRYSTLTRSAADDPSGKGLLQVLLTLILHIESSPDLSSDSRIALTARAKRLAAEVLGTPAWYQCLPIIARFDPSAVLRLAENMPGQGWARKAVGHVQETTTTV